MKKYIALLCMAALCLQLAACDLLSDGQDPKYNQLIQDLESGNYVQAQTAAVRLPWEITKAVGSPGNGMDNWIAILWHSFPQINCCAV